MATPGESLVNDDCDAKGLGVVNAKLGEQHPINALIPGGMQEALLFKVCQVARFRLGDVQHGHATPVLGVFGMPNEKGLASVC